MPEAPRSIDDVIPTDSTSNVSRVSLRYQRREALLDRLRYDPESAPKSRRRDRWGKIIDPPHPTNSSEEQINHVSKYSKVEGTYLFADGDSPIFDHSLPENKRLLSEAKKPRAPSKFGWNYKRAVAVALLSFLPPLLSCGYQGAEQYDKPRPSRIERAPCEDERLKAYVEQTMPYSSPPRF